MPDLQAVQNHHRGFSLLECVIGLSFFAFISLAGMEFFNLARERFLRFQSQEQTAADIFAAVDKLTIDLHAAGAGLQIPCSLGIIRPLETDGDELTCLTECQSLIPEGNLITGQTEIQLSFPASPASGQEICFFDRTKGEVIRIADSSKTSITLSAPLKYSYSQTETGIILLQKTAFFLDDKNHVLRRKVNASPAQPLCDPADTFTFKWDGNSKLLSFNISAGGENGLTYETTICPKNLQLLSN